MRNIYLGLIIFLQIFTTSCQKENYKIIKGDLFIKYIDFGSLYPNSLEEIEKKFDSLKNSKLNNQNKELVNYFTKLKNENLIDKPSFSLRLENGEIIKVFLSEEEYLKLKKFDWKILSDKKKLSIEANIKQTELGFHYAKKIIDAKIVDGKTYSKK